MSTVVVNRTFPQLNYLASHLASQGDLTALVHPFLDIGQPWLAQVARIPWLGPTLRKDLSRRLPPSNVTSSEVVLGGTREDVVYFMLARMHRKLGWPSRRVLHHVHMKMIKRISEAAIHVDGPVNIICASYGTAYEAFKAGSVENRPKRVLDYPVAHHHYAEALLREDMQKRPDFANMMQMHDLPKDLKLRLDREIDLADIVLVGSDFAKRSFVESGCSPDKIAVVPYGTDSCIFYPSVAMPKSEEFSIIFVGQIGQRKGISYLLDAYKEFQRPNTRLTLIGNAVGDSKALAPYAHLFERLPHISRLQLREQFQRASVLVLPSLIEGMPLVVLEAMSCGVPVIVTDRGADQVVRDGVDGFVVPAGSVESIRVALSTLYTDRAMSHEMGRSASERAKQFSWSAYSRHVVDLLGAL